MTRKGRIETIESPYVRAAGHENFTSLVLENSDLGPVLVNFWSRKAGPCLRQYPVLDKVIHGYQGKVLLINIDIDHEFEVTRQYGITSVPTLKLFRNRNVIETRHGYQSESDLKKLLDDHVVRDSDSVLARAVEQYAQGERDAAYQTIAQAIVNDPENPRLPLAMCKMLKHEQRYHEAVQLMDTLPEATRQTAEIAQLYDLLKFYLRFAPTMELQPLKHRLTLDPDDLDARQQLVVHYAIQQDFNEALQQLVEIMDTDQSYQDNFAQRAMLTLFSIIGNADPLVAKYRGHLRRYSH